MQRRLNLYLAVRATEDPETVIWAVLDSNHQPAVIGTFPRLPGPPVATVQAISEMLADLMGMRLTEAPVQAGASAKETAPAAGAFRRGDPNLN